MNKRICVLLSLVSVLVGAVTMPAVAGELVFSDDFNREDGPVDNDWTTWWGPFIDDPFIRIRDGELHTIGYPSLAGGVFRTLPVGLPLTFAFDFHTRAVRQCSPDHESWSNDGGWLIGFNIATGHPFTALAQVRFYQYSGLRHVRRLYLTDPGIMVEDTSSPTPEPLPDQREFGDTPVAHIEGTINSDLSAAIRVFYNDGEDPDPVLLNFNAPADANPTPPGSVLVFGNSSCADGPHIFSNLQVTYQSR